MPIPDNCNGSHYKIFSVLAPTYGVDLNFGNPLGTISSYNDNDNSDHRKWKVTTVGYNQVTLESVAAPGSYASFYVEADGAPLVGNAKRTVWNLKEVDPDVYQITTPDGLLVWELPLAHDFVTILLRPAHKYEGKDAQWTFKAIG